MSSDEIKNKIEALKIALEDFIRQVNNILLKYQDFDSKIESINSLISDSQDTSMIQGISTANDAISKTISSLRRQIESEKAIVISNVNKKIDDYEALLRNALAKEERQRQELMKKNSNT